MKWTSTHGLLFIRAAKVGVMEKRSIQARDCACDVMLSGVDSPWNRAKPGSKDLTLYEILPKPHHCIAVSYGMPFGIRRPIDCTDLFCSLVDDDDTL